jgi:Holliday junction resolvase RusA-like endonuclease
MIEANPHHKGWRDEVITAARMAMGTQGTEKFLGPLKVELLFEMPKGSTVRRHSPETAPDVDKLTRTIFDALEQAGVVQNDAQICDVHAVKIYGTTRTGVTIEVNYL